MYFFEFDANIINFYNMLYFDLIIYFTNFFMKKLNSVLRVSFYKPIYLLQ